MNYNSYKNTNQDLGFARARGDSRAGQAEDGAPRKILDGRYKILKTIGEGRFAK